ncbi:unnamed protein product [Didymodactylos carnosus]|uniref:FAD-binding domain-containing protein n=2 Tax=Didymodactylos carnosus TaxID=1234261 RepID=A0A815I0N0_9BILA|nr:unnamed protein product [Didymodactylos carnosus]CAF4235723.1 unnamed protein product [Didymodactylos carnosus]
MQTNSSLTTVLVIGGGIAGPVVSLFLKKHGYHPILFEKVQQLADVGASLNCAPNGLKAFSTLNLSDDLIKCGGLIELISWRQSDGTILAENDFLKQVSQRYGFPFVGLKRSKLLAFLHAQVEGANIEKHMGKKLINIEQTDSSVIAYFEDKTQFTGSFLIGADGLHSTVRQLLFGKDTVNYTGVTEIIGVSTRPTGLCSEKGVLLQIAGVGGHIVSYPFSETHCMYACSLEESANPESWKTVSIEEMEEFKCKSKFSQWTEPTVRHLLQNTEKLMKIGIYDRDELPIWYKERVILIGDAAHGTSPHVGQGGNLAMEDAYYLTKMLPASGESYSLSTSTLKTIFQQFTDRRRPRTTEIVKRARKEGEDRVLNDVTACKARDEARRNLFSTPASMEIADRLYNIEL